MHNIPLHVGTDDGGPVLSRKEAAKLLRVSLPQLDRYRRENNLPAVWLDSHPRFLREDLIAFATSKRRAE